MEEVWKPIINFDNLYEVSNLGRVRSCDRQVNCSRGANKRLWKGKILSQIIAATRKYSMVSLSKKGTVYKKYVHRLVAEAFLENPKETVNHKDGNKQNNSVSNLEWCSYSENNKHAYRQGLKQPSPVKGYKEN
jgi:hypothetical protein